MSKSKILLVHLFCSLYLLSASSAPNPNASSFIEAECLATLYPSVCIQSLSTFSKTVQKSPKQLARAALSVGLSRAQSGSAFISKMALMRGLKPMERSAVKDCAANMASAVDQLSRSLKELGRMGSQKLSWHQSNVESWIGAAITFQQTCIDGFSSPTMAGNVKVAVMKRALDCKQVTSNALVLIHRYAAAKRKHGAFTKTANLP
ncbi:21 kDa protein-like [Salvia miltiorrhiza]|uniref:21 kDa protein-like n=1 Tax=Salvia miltiorrhiza TaxID=226208 RepID=UPI0025AD8CAF|nr:21 kDa protein-like [Salvia miltiorrhiza]